MYLTPIDSSGELLKNIQTNINIGRAGWCRLSWICVEKGVYSSKGRSATRGIDRQARVLSIKKISRSHPPATISRLPLIRRTSRMFISRSSSIVADEHASSDDYGFYGAPFRSTIDCYSVGWLLLKGAWFHVNVIEEGSDGYIWQRFRNKLALGQSTNLSLSLFQQGFWPPMTCMWIC